MGTSQSPTNKVRIRNLVVTAAQYPLREAPRVDWQGDQFTPST